MNMKSNSAAVRVVSRLPSAHGFHDRVPSGRSKVFSTGRIDATQGHRFASENRLRHFRHSGAVVRRGHRFAFLRVSTAVPIVSFELIACFSMVVDVCRLVFTCVVFLHVV